MITEMLRTITERYHLNGIDPKEYKKLKASGMEFQIWAFEAEGLGNVSAMTASGFFGLMKMDTLIITPTQMDMPLFSYDRVHAMGNDTLIFELYDTLLGQPDLSGLERVKSAAASLPDHDLGAHWYDSIKLAVSLSKKGKKKETPAFDQTVRDYLAAYLDACGTAPICTDANVKREKASVYVEGLLEHGGPSTDVFKKSIGEEKTGELFRKYLFATKP